MADQISLPMKCFLDAVVNPFTADRPCQVPDGYTHRTIPLQDWNDYESMVTNSPQGTVVGGQLLMLCVGQNELTAQAFTNVNTYTVLCIDIDNNGLLLFDNTGVGFPTLPTANYAAINGAAPGINVDTALVDSFRLFAAGLRVLPKIELITDSTTVAVSQYYAGLATPNSINKAYNHGENIFDVVRQSTFIQQFQNSTGASVRLDPFDFSRFLDMRTLANWSNIINFDTSFMLFPTIAILYTFPITNPTPYVGQSVPIRFQSQMWLEGQLVQPTPIFSTQSPMDMAYETIVKSIAYQPETYPIVTQGHSFTTIFNKVGTIVRSVGAALQMSSAIMPPPYRDLVNTAGGMAQLVPVLRRSNMTNRNPVTLPRRKKKKRARTSMMGAPPRVNAYVANRGGRRRGRRPRY